ncbi:MAG: SDR family NAD(P)-dependent oxidoreductase [Proteobacteria bacterium]|nr:SDR family NAD(P)-dependent oxidoreductase [Pseudomonadota bacterium]
MGHYTFAGKHILITGATGGLGSALAGMLAEKGAHMVLSARSDVGLKHLLSSLPGPNHIAIIPADLSIPGQADVLATKALEHLGYIDALFNIAGVGYFSLMEDVSNQNLRHLFELNTFAPLQLMTALVPHMKKRGQGRIINLVSCTGRIPIPTEGVYGGSKSAFAIMANTMRLELSTQNIHIITIYPGTVATDFEKHALREKKIPGVCPLDSRGATIHETTLKILDAAAGPSGEVWFETKAKWMAAVSLILPGLVDKRFDELKKKALGPASLMFEAKKRPWRLVQIESSLACNLKCIMCPWIDERIHVENQGNLKPSIWNAIKPHLPMIQSIDFSGGGEPLMQPHLAQWISDARKEGCETGFLTNGLLLNKEKADHFLSVGLDWICFSMDGSNKKIYDSIRLGSNFDTVCKNVSYFCGSPLAKSIKTMINFVIMSLNQHQLEDMIKRAADLGVAQVNFKQCDVIRGVHGKGYGLFSPKKTKEIRHLEKALERAQKLGKKLGVNTTAFSFTPEELPVCAQDPRNSLFIRYNGQVSPCINLAIGGPTTFLGKDVTMPSIHYGRLPDQNLEQLWNTESCTLYKTRFEQRVSAYDDGFMQVDLSEPSLQKLKAANQSAINAMPDAPKGCRICHYLYGI